MGEERFETLAESRQRTRELARQALAPALKPGRREVPEAFLTAIADGVGDRASLAREGREAFTREQPMELVLFDTDRIGEFVFESSRPPVIRGASRILERLNEEFEKEYAGKILFSGGGEGLLLLPAGRGERTCDYIERVFRDASAGALSVTTACLPVAPQDFVPAGRNEEEARDGVRLLTGTPAVLARLRDAVRRKKDERPPDDKVVPGGATRCVSCRDRAGAIDLEKYRKDELGRLLCDPCDRRWATGKGLIAGTEFQQITALYARALGQEEVEGSRARQLGFLYADGNAMGALFGKLRSLAELRTLSRGVAWIFARLRDRVTARVQEQVGVDEDGHPPLVSLLAGGDEAIWILPAALAIETALALPEWLQADAETLVDLPPLLARAGLSRLTAGMGLVICGETFPVRYQYDLARALQKNAKSLYYGGAGGESREDSSLDFEVLTDSSPMSDDLRAARAITYRTDDPAFLRTCRPYRASDLARLHQALQAAEQQGIRRTQLYHLQAAAEEGRRPFMNSVRYQLGRKSNVGKACCRWLEELGVDLTSPPALDAFFTWEGRPGPQGRETVAGTWVPDLVQLAPYLELLNDGKEIEDAAA